MTVIEFPSSPRLSEQLGRYRFDPLGFVMFAFPWGRPGTSLATETGPEPWQREVLEKLGSGLKQRDGSAGSTADRTDGSEAAVRYANKRAEMWGT